MVLCFEMLIKILLFCSKQGTTQKVLCARVLSSINSKYSYELESDDITVSKLMMCKIRLSLDQIDKLSEAIKNWSVLSPNQTVSG